MHQGVIRTVGKRFEEKSQQSLMFLQTDEGESSILGAQNPKCIEQNPGGGEIDPEGSAEIEERYCKGYAYSRDDSIVGRPERVGAGIGRCARLTGQREKFLCWDSSRMRL